MIQKAYNDTEFTLQLNTKAKQDAADKLIRKGQRTDHPRHRHNNRRDDRSTDRSDSRQGHKTKGQEWTTLNTDK